MKVRGEGGKRTSKVVWVLHVVMLRKKHEQ